MINLTSLPEIEEFIEDHPFSFIYISRPNCGVCHAVLPHVKEILKEFPLIQLGFVNADEVEEVAGRFSVFTVPALLLFIGGRETIREARFVHMQALQAKISKVYQLALGDL